MDNKISITTTNGEFKTFIGKESSAMISFSENDFTIVFQNKDSVLSSDSVNTISSEEIFLPALICTLEDIILQATPNCNILYNNIINVETIFTGYVIGKIFRNEDITDLQEKITNNQPQIIDSDELKESLHPLIEKAASSDEIEFSNLEDEMFLLIEGYLNNLQ